MEHIAIIVDGKDTVAHDGSVGFTVGAVRQPRRPITGFAIAVLTAVVSMGALGPRIVEVDKPGAAACADHVDAAVAAADALDAPASPTASPLAWWLLPQVAEWVDPATGQSRQARADHVPRAVNDPHLAR